MTRAALSLLITIGTLFSLVAPALAEETRTYALIVANNGSVDDGVKPLRYADDDGARYYEIFSNLAQETHLLTVLDRDSQRVFPAIAPKTQPPTRAQLRRTVAHLKTKIDADRAAGHRAELYLIFTGHGNVDTKGQGYLSLQDGKLQRNELYRDVLRPLNANYTHLIIDACHAYFMVQSRGGDPWNDDRSGQTHNSEFQAYLNKGTSKRATIPSTVGVILSTSGTAEVHEWSRLRGGVFSHQLRSGLLGGADVNGDGAVSYLELGGFLAAANIGVKNPKARINVFARPPSQNTQQPLVRLSEFNATTTLELDEKTTGRYYLEDARGLRYADVNTAQGHATRLVMLHKPVNGQDYYLRNTNTQARVELNGTQISSQKLAFLDVEDQARGSVEAAYRTSLFSVPFGPGFYAGYMAGRDRSEDTLNATNTLNTTPNKGPGFSLGFGYAASSSLLGPNASDLGLTGPQHNLDVDLRQRGPGLTYGAFLSYGITDGNNIIGHRAAIGGQLGWRWQWDTVSLTPLLRLGPQAILLQGDCTNNSSCADPIGLRSEASLSLGVKPVPSLMLEVRAGLGMDVATFANIQSGGEQLLWSPFLGAGARF